MKKYMKTMIAIILTIIGFGLLLWRFWPHTLANVISADESTVTSLACTVGISGLKDDGTTFIDNYQLQSLTKGSEDFDAIIDILKSSKYRQGFQNLLPWAITSIDSEGDSNKTANVFLVWGNNQSDTCYLSFHGIGRVVVSIGTNDGLLVYHATDDSILDRLVDYVQEHGIKN